MGSTHDEHLPHDPSAVPSPRRRGGGRPAGVPGLRVSRRGAGPARRRGRIAAPDGPFVLAEGLATPGDISVQEAADLTAAEWRRQADAGHTEESTAYAVMNHAARFAKFAAAHGIDSLAEVDREVCEFYVHSPNAPGYGTVRADGRPAPAENATKHGRRNYLRALFRTCRALGLDDRDPAVGIPLPPRAADRSGRLATAEEVQRCKDASLTTVRESRLPCALALILAGHHTVELPYSMTEDAFPEHGLVWARGSGATAQARWLPLDD